MSTYVVGDIQGCYQELIALLKSVEFDKSVDHLWVTGDMINRGPNNIETINFLRQLPNVQIVLGNHDLHFLAVALTARTPSRSDTFQDLLESDELPEVINWMRHQPLAFYSDEFDALMVHAGIPSNWSISEALEYAAEVEAVLQDERHQGYFELMYGDKPDVFSKSLKGIDRWRVITNYLTRLRFCSSNSAMEFATKSDVAPTGYAPWFTYPRQDSTRVLFGHWASIEGKTSSSQFVALDTGCVWGHSLSALRMEDNKLFSVPAISSR
ncbi:MAG: bis(5'-nucleosyl)-tetraphosphatase (symmetrical) [Candidatus Azotimanducaceae bacterium]